MNALPPKFTTRDIADLLRMSPGFIRGEIQDGRLKANIVRRGKKTIYRVELEDLKAYCAEHWPRVRVPAA